MEEEEEEEEEEEMEKEEHDVNKGSRQKPKTEKTTSYPNQDKCPLFANKKLVFAFLS